MPALRGRKRPEVDGERPEWTTLEIQATRWRMRDLFERGATRTGVLFGLAVGLVWAGAYLQTTSWTVVSNVPWLRLLWLANPFLLIVPILWLGPRDERRPRTVGAVQGALLGVLLVLSATLWTSLGSGGFACVACCGAGISLVLPAAAAV